MTDKVIYKSKVSPLLLSILILIMGWIVFESIRDGIQLNWVSLGITLGLSLILFYPLFSIRYILNPMEDELRIKIGIIPYGKVALSKIKKIEETTNPISSPAASLDRLAIVYNTYDSVLVSPKEKSKFIEQLTLTNPEIEVVLKKENTQP